METKQQFIQFANYCDTTLNLNEQLVKNNRQDPNLSFYKSLPLCIIDAVYSIGVKYTSVERATNSFLRCFNLNIEKGTDSKTEYTIDNFITDMNTFSTFEDAAINGFNNKQRTSSVNGILKAEACFRVAKAFKKHGINTLNDFNTYSNKQKLDIDILSVKGQGSGIMLKYLYMLAGNDNVIKPDRHMVNFIKGVFPHITIGQKDHNEIAEIITESTKILTEKYAQLTPRFLDYLIWEYMKQLN
ncbi:MAG: hypothetical protein IJW54_01135 [Clostridia bacterium]|nr:hypothetical protein [Clostridia bacterium]